MGKVFVVTTPTLNLTGYWSPRFLYEQGIPEAARRNVVWGILLLRPLHALEKENPHFGSCGTGVRPDSKQMLWDIRLFRLEKGATWKFDGTVTMVEPEEEGLQSLLDDAFSAMQTDTVTLLMNRGLFDRFRYVCTGMHVDLPVHHHPVALSTS